VTKVPFPAKSSIDSTSFSLLFHSLLSNYSSLSLSLRSLRAALLLTLTCYTAYVWYGFCRETSCRTEKVGRETEALFLLLLLHSLRIPASDSAPTLVGCIRPSPTGRQSVTYIGLEKSLLHFSAEKQISKSEKYGFLSP